ncbi:MAG TPA: hypothetical protein DD979_16500 [Gammaproteobacteria bacterium]|jgi:hypothetical protein|nr:hypothetical protein [Gammaproteobacteria bacterium]
MNPTYPLPVSADKLTALEHCPRCGNAVDVLFEDDTANLSSGQPFVHIRCHHCAESMSSQELLGDLSNAPILDKYARMAQLWNQRAKLLKLKRMVSRLATR